MKEHLKQDLEKELSAHELNKYTKSSKKNLDKLGKAEQNELVKLESRNYLRNAKVVQFIKSQLKKFKSMGTKIMANQVKYMHARKKIWMENDELNRMENQKVYEEELRAYTLRFNMIKRQIDKNFRKMEKRAHRHVAKVSEKILVKQLKKYAKRLNEEYHETLRADYDTFWAEEVRITREMDHEMDKEWKEDLKLANIASAKLN
jgi:hypothetical protein